MALKRTITFFALSIVLLSSFGTYAKTDNSPKVFLNKEIINICKLPENILACELKLGNCPQKCRPTSCQTPENILACPLNLNSCPTECRYGRTTNTPTDICKLPVNTLACGLMLGNCPQQCRPLTCKLPANVLACDLKLNDCPKECRFGW